MKGSLALGRIAGIRLSVHWTFILILIYAFSIYYQRAQDPLEGLMGVLFILALFICVVLHELGHALTAKSFNIMTKSITLLPIGGIARLEKFPEKPKEELLVVVAGPLVNVVIAFLIYLLLYATNNLPSFTEEPENLVELTGAVFLFNLLVANVVLAVFNFIPAFPMDGGRILRALLSFKFSREKATRIAAGIGQFIAILFFFVGFYFNIWLVLIGVFIFLGAGAEAEFEISKTALSGHKVRDVLMKKFIVLLPEDTLEKAVQYLLDGQAQEFVVAKNEKVLGILSRDELIKGLSADGNKSKVSDAMRKDYLTLDPDMPLQEVYQKIMQTKCPVAPVMENGKFIGIVDKENIDEFIMVKRAMK